MAMPLVDTTGVCPESVHEQIKADDRRWAELQPVAPFVDDAGRPVVELGNCVCGSTLARQIGGV